MKLNIDNSESFLMVSESEHNADMYYATGFLAYDSFIYLNSNKETILVSDMELGRAQKESKVDEVVPTSKYNLMDKFREHKDPDIAYCEMIIEFLRAEGLDIIGVPYNFPVQLADCIRNAGFNVRPIKSPFREMREVKKEFEIKAIEYAQRAGERALDEGINAIKHARIRNGVLWQEKEPLRTEDVRGIIERSLLSMGCEAPDLIIASEREALIPTGAVGVIFWPMNLLLLIWCRVQRMKDIILI